MYEQPLFAQYNKAIWLENQLGSPFDNSNLFSFKSILELDEQSLFPIKQTEYLNSLAVNHFFVPAKLGGDLTSFEEMALLFRSIYRRDSTIGLGYGSTTFMASVHIYIAGSEFLQHRISELILNGKTISIGYHEKEHGNDLLANEVKLSPQQNDFFTLNGTKWVINNIANSAAITTFVKTSDQGGTRGYSLVFIDKNKVTPDSLTYHPKIKTHGVKGCRIASVTFNNLTLHQSAFIGNYGGGFELTVKGFQITRAVLPSMAIGMGDTALRCALQFAEARELYGKTIASIPHVQELLVACYINLLISDCISIGVTRGLHVIPEQMSVIAAIAKFQIPKLILASLKDLAIILGSRFFMREGEYGIFQKIFRDFPIVSLGHSSDVICLNTILPQLKALLSQNFKSKQGESRVQKIFSLDHPLEEFNYQQLKMSNNGKNDIINTLTAIPVWLTSLKLDEDVREIIKTFVNELMSTYNKLSSSSNINNYQLKEFSHLTYQIAETYCKIFSAICCLLTWLYNFSKISSFFDSGIWLILALQQLFPNLDVIPSKLRNSYIHLANNHLNTLSSSFLSFSIVPIQYK